MREVAALPGCGATKARAPEGARARGLVGAMVLGVLGVVGCGGPGPAEVRLPRGKAGVVAWRAALSRFEELRRPFETDRPVTLNLSLEIDQPLLGKRMRARGAVAIARPAGLRMILLGPGGTTALDLWICEDAFRFALPALDLVRRGDAGTPPDQLRGLPLDFLRWWLLRPLAGDLLYATERTHARHPVWEYALRDGEDVVKVWQPRALLAASGAAAAPQLWASRLSRYDEQRVEARGGLCGTASYRQRSTGLVVEVVCESVAEAAPPRRAFADPDDPSAGCAALGETPP